MNRILWNSERDKSSDGRLTIDEIVVHQATVHFEQMSKDSYWLSITLLGTDPLQSVDVNFWAEDGKLYCTMQEDNIAWEENAQHE